MAGLVPAIHVLFRAKLKEDVDARDICAKTRFALLRGHDGVFRRRLELETVCRQE
jgi:hypothetical protein